MTAAESQLTSVHCEIQEFSRHMHPHTQKNSQIPMTNNLQCPVNASERQHCSWLGNDQGVFPAFFKMDSDFFTFQLLNKAVCETSLTTEVFMFKMSVFHSKVQNNKFWQKWLLHVKFSYWCYLFYILQRYYWSRR